MNRESQPETTTIPAERIATVSYLPASTEVTLSEAVEERVEHNATIIYFPTPGAEPTSERASDWLKLELAERTVEDFKRKLGLLAVEGGLDR